SMHSKPRLSSLNDRAHVVGVAIDRHTTFDDGEGEPFGSQVALVDGYQGGELRAGGMAHDENAIGVAAILRDVIVHPMNGFRHIAKDIDHLDVRQQPVARGYEDEALFNESLRFQLNTRA